MFPVTLLGHGRALWADPVVSRALPVGVAEKPGIAEDRLQRSRKLLVAQSRAGSVSDGTEPVQKQRRLSAAPLCLIEPSRNRHRMDNTIFVSGHLPHLCHFQCVAYSETQTEKLRGRRTGELYLLIFLRYLKWVFKVKKSSQSIFSKSLLKQL